MKRPLLALALLMFTTPSLLAKDGSIALATQFSASFSQGMVYATLTASNVGTEVGIHLQPVIQLGEWSATGTPLETLPVNESFRWSIPLGPPPAIPGIYTIQAAMSYEDANGFPLSVFYVSPLLMDPDPTGQDLFSVAAQSTRLREETSLTITLTSMHTSDLILSLRLLLPQGQIATDNDRLSVSLPALGKTTLTLPLRRAACVAGSRYVIHVIADTIVNDKHVSVSGRARVVITDLPAALESLKEHPRIVTGIALLLLVLAAVPNHTRRYMDTVGLPLELGRISNMLVLIAIFVFMAMHFPWKWIFTATMTSGGDTVSHHYLASHLKESLFRTGSIISWAPGWWNGFPAFQYYFCLPYLLMVLLSMIIPLEIAFKLVTLLGLFGLPYCAWQSARWMKLPDPGPVLLAIGTSIIIFDDGHTMWGVNGFSTLAGMISNSLSFSIMLLFLGSAVRDANDGSLRRRTVAFLALMLASHFFTSIIACLVCLTIPLLRPRAGFLRSLWVLGAGATLGLSLVAWWWIPLLAKQEFTVDFGENWVIDAWTTLPLAIRWLLPFASIGVLIAWLRHDMFGRLHAIMALVAVLLFFFGYDHVAPVFVNNRLWPFVLYGLLALAVSGLSPLIRHYAHPKLAITGIFLLTLCWGTPAGSKVATWARWNYTGAESKPLWPVYQHLVIDALTATAGRLAYDLAPENEALGSSRIFESVPYRIGKPILEGGIVNSAEGSLFAYIVQGESSTNSAGYPNIVTPAEFNWSMATRHLELFNVKHFIARWSGTRAAIASDPQWKHMASVGPWELYDLTSNDGHYVVVPEREPLAVRLNSDEDRPWQKAGLEWFYAHESLDQPYLFLNPGQPSPYSWMNPMSETDFTSQLKARKLGASVQEPIPVDAPAAPVSEEEITSSHIRFVTKAIGEPHLIKISYFPNWKVRGAATVYRATPNFMVVYPEQADVELTYGATGADQLGWAITCAGWLLFLPLCYLMERRS